MIVIDTSALVAVVRREPEAEEFNEVMFKARVSLVAAPTALEFFMVTAEKRGTGNPSPYEIFERPGIVIQPWTERHLALVRVAFAEYGKGRGHRAQLNFGDCISYALAKAENAPLLYKGGDFALTDVRAAV